MIMILYQEITKTPRILKFSEICLKRVQIFTKCFIINLKFLQSTRNRKRKDVPFAKSKENNPNDKKKCTREMQ